MAKTIIVVDDSFSLRKALGTTLLDAGYHVIEAEDGMEGLQKIHENPDAALIVCDVNMPHLGGLDMVDLVRQNPARRDVPIIMLTTEMHPDMVARAKAAGVKGWLVKPFKEESILSTVRKLAGPA